MRINFSNPKSGYDLLEDFSRISALTNCGGFDKAFTANDISEFGLIKEYFKQLEEAENGFCLQCSKVVVKWL